MHQRQAPGELCVLPSAKLMLSSVLKVTPLNYKLD